MYNTGTVETESVVESEVDSEPEFESKESDSYSINVDEWFGIDDVIILINDS